MRVRRGVGELIGRWFDYLLCPETELTTIASESGWAFTIIEREVRHLAILTMS